MRTVRVMTAALAAMLLSIGALAAPGFAQTSDNANPCAPGQPLGRPPGTPPNQPGKPDGRPAQYPPSSCALAISKASAARGESVAVSGSGFAPGEAVVLSMSGQNVRTMTADPNGNIAGDIVVPDNAQLGRTEIRAESATQTLSAAFEVVAAPAAGRSRSTAAAAAGGLARTGTYIAGTAATGILLLALGATLVVAARRRRVATA